jgi:hypothetical protein
MFGYGSMRVSTESDVHELLEWGGGGRLGYHELSLRLLVMLSGEPTVVPAMGCPDHILISRIWICIEDLEVGSPAVGM